MFSTLPCLRRIIREHDEYLERRRIIRRFLQANKMSSFSLQVVAPIRGYHVYKELWEPNIGESLSLCRSLSSCSQLKLVGGGGVPGGLGVGVLGGLGVGNLGD